MKSIVLHDSETESFLKRVAQPECEPTADGSAKRTPVPPDYLCNVVHEETRGLESHQQLRVFDHSLRLELGAREPNGVVVQTQYSQS
jgi:hypothetical protein